MSTNSDILFVCDVCRSQLSRLMGQLHSLKGNHEGAMKSFAEDVYFSSIEYGPSDVRTSLGYFNLAKVFQSQGAVTESTAFMRKVVSIWLTALIDLVVEKDGATTGSSTSSLPVVMSQVYEVVDMLIDIRNTFEVGAHGSAAEVELAIALALMHVSSGSGAEGAGGGRDEALGYIQRAREVYAAGGGTGSEYDITRIADAAQAILVAENETSSL